MINSSDKRFPELAFAETMTDEEFKHLRSVTPRFISQTPPNSVHKDELSIVFDNVELIIDKEVDTGWFCWVHILLDWIEDIVRCCWPLKVH